MWLDWAYVEAKADTAVVRVLYTSEFTSRADSLAAEVDSLRASIEFLNLMIQMQTQALADHNLALGAVRLMIEQLHPSVIAPPVAEPFTPSGVRL